MGLEIGISPPGTFILAVLSRENKEPGTLHALMEVQDLG